MSRVRKGALVKAKYVLTVQGPVDSDEDLKRRTDAAKAAGVKTSVKKL